MAAKESRTAVKHFFEPNSNSACEKTIRTSEQRPRLGNPLRHARPSGPEPRRSGAMWGEGRSGETRLPAGVNNIKAIAGGRSHSLALRSDGSVVAWGINSWGQTTVPPSLTGVKSVAAGYNHSLALRVDGSVVAWGNNTWGQTNVPDNLLRVTAVACGAFHNLALKSDGTVISWGLISYMDNYCPDRFVGCRRNCGWFLP